MKKGSNTFTKSCSEIPVPESLTEIARFVLDAAVAFRERSTSSRDMAAELGPRIPDWIRENPIVRAPGHIALLGRVLGLLSGLSRTLDSDVDLLRTILPYALKPPTRPPA